MSQVDSGQILPESARLEQWIAEARSGDASALGKMLELYRSYLCQIANESRSLPATGIAPSDIVQETMLRATQGFEKFRGTTSRELLAWLRQMLTHQTIDALRRSNADKRGAGRVLSLEEQDLAAMTVATSDPTASSAFRRREESESIRSALDQLRDDFREVIELRIFEGFTFAEIGARLDCSADSVRKLWWRAIDHLAQEIDA